MRAEPVTSDWQVAKSMAGDESGLCWTSAEIAENIGITVFQITARLKGMEGRNLVERAEGYWRLTDTGYQLGTGAEPPKKEKPPIGERVYQTPTGGWYTPGSSAAALPDDSAVPRRDPAAHWRMRYEWGRQNPKYGIAETEVEVFIDEEGTEWVRCVPTEPAELVVEWENGLSPMRLIRRNGSTAVDRQIIRQQKEHKKLKDHMEAHKRKLLGVGT